ncbi:beta-galactosidase GalB [Mucilaginibacter calamicampi]|uniref:Beta-galactosidase GalB n=1 Tax=Mucilaginibacter calamicampi TaxID=1302352 RepID=A0ABW2YWJ4_9SPHI
MNFVSSKYASLRLLLLCATLLFYFDGALAQTTRIPLTKGWKFYKYGPNEKPDSLIYDARPDANGNSDGIAADAKPTEAIKMAAAKGILKYYILPTGNAFLKDETKRTIRPDGNPGANFQFTQNTFNDSKWEDVTLPHDWAIKGPFYQGQGTIIGGGMGRLPVQGVAWYRHSINIAAQDAEKSIFLDFDGVMSYAMVWVNGKLAGGWPYGYNSWRVDITKYVRPGGVNKIAVRVDNPANSSRWYPGAGIYRNVWLVKTNTVHVAQWGTFIKTERVSAKSATVNLKTTIDNDSEKDGTYSVKTTIYLTNGTGIKKIEANIAPVNVTVKARSSNSVLGSATILNPKLWEPLPAKIHSRYVAITTVTNGGKTLDTYSTPFGIRDIQFDAMKGLLVNGKKTLIKGVNQHSDLGALGMAFNRRAAERQLEILRDMGCNAIRMSHNPPDPELLELTDKMGFLVMDEVFDGWERKKTALDFHLIFPDWQEQDLRAMIRRDKNHPSIILWGFGNEVGEQYTDKEGAALASRLIAIAKDEDPTRLYTLSMNYAKADMPLPQVVDVIGLNYQGEGIRNAPAYSGLQGITAPPSFPAFHNKFPDKVIVSLENAAAVSSRGEYMFPVYDGDSSPIKDGQGGNAKTRQVSAYDLYTVDFGSSADKVFATMAKHPFVAGGFVWSGWDYLGEPTPYSLSRSSYFGIIDLAGFKKDRYYLYQSQWRAELPMAHILPHWNWTNRAGEITPVHVFTSGDEAELFLNGKSLGRKKMAPYEYRIRWSDVKYQPGELKVVAYKNGNKWAEETIKTTGAAQKLALAADRTTIKADGDDLSFITVRVTDAAGLTVPDAKNAIKFSIEGPGEIVATDNGDAANMIPFPSHEREAFNGYALVIVRGKAGRSGAIKIKAESNGLISSTLKIDSQ